MQKTLLCLLLLEVMVHAAVRIPLDNADFEKKDYKPFEFYILVAKK